METASLNSLGGQWQRAALALGIECRAPFTLSTPAGGTFEFACLLPQFGSNRGMLLLANYDKAAASAAMAAGFGFSCVESASLKDQSDLATYTDCLIDWGWLESLGPAPSWYVAAMRNAV